MQTFIQKALRGGLGDTAIDFVEVDTQELLHVNILAKREVHVSAALERLTNALLAPGLHIKSRKLLQRLHLGGEQESKDRRVEASKEKRLPVKRKHEEAESDDEDIDTLLKSADTEGREHKAKSPTEKLLAELVRTITGKSSGFPELKTEDRAVLASYEYVLREFARQTLFNLLVYGFSPWCVGHHSEFGDVPLTFPLEDLRVRFRIHKRHSYEMRYFSSKPTSLRLVGMSEVEMPTAGTWVLEGPSPEGKLRSVVAGLVDYALQCADLIRSAAAAEMHIAYPTVVVNSATSGKGDEGREMQTHKENTLLGPNAEASLQYDASVLESKRMAEEQRVKDAPDAWREQSPSHIVAQHTRMVPRSSDSLPWLYNVQDASGMDGQVTAPALKSTLQSVADYHHLMSELVCTRLGMPHDSSDKASGGDNPFKGSGGSGSASAAQGGDVQDPRMRVTMQFWTTHLRRFLVYLLDSVCGIEDADVVFPALVDVPMILNKLETECILPTPALREQLSEATSLPAECFISPSLLKAVGDTMVKESEAKADAEKNKAQARLEALKLKFEEKKLKMELAFKEKELQLKIREAEIKMQLAEEKTKCDIRLAKEKQQADIANQTAKTQADVQNSTLMTQTKARATAAVADARVASQKSKKPAS